MSLLQLRITNYQVYLQVVLRNGDEQLINVTENTKTAAYIPHELTDYVFDTFMGEKEIITIDNIKYEKSSVHIYSNFRTKMDWECTQFLNKSI